MAAQSYYLANKLIDHLFRAIPYTAPTTLYIGLFTTTPSPSGPGTEVSTVGTGYARYAIPASNTAGFRPTQGGTTGASSGTSEQTSNIAPIIFPTATSSWGTITAWGVFDAVTGGNMLIFANLTLPLLVPLAYAPTFSTDELIIQIDS